MTLATHARESQVSSLRFFRLTGVSRKRHKDEKFFFSFSIYKKHYVWSKRIKRVSFLDFYRMLARLYYFGIKRQKPRHITWGDFFI